MSSEASQLGDGAASRSFSGYSPFVLGIYDFWVHGINNRFFWKCPTRHLLDLYRAHLTDNHLEIGLGTGYLLDKTGLPGANPRLVLCDMNPHCLQKAAHRVQRFHPITHQADILQPLEGLGRPFRSVGLNYVLHCLPGDWEAKRCVLDHVAAWLEPGGTFFGSTLLGRGVPISAAARWQLRWLNARKYFSNGQDSLSALKESLQQTFAQSEVTVHGCAALFWGRTREA
jgi:SAM-dependent methyltransferase